MVNTIHHRPQERLGIVNNMIKDLRSDINDFARPFGIEVDGRVVAVGGHLLPHPTMLYAHHILCIHAYAIRDAHRHESRHICILT